MLFKIKTQVTIIFSQWDRKKILRSNFKWGLEQLQDMQNKYLALQIQTKYVDKLSNLQPLTA